MKQAYIDNEENNHPGRQWHGVPDQPRDSLPFIAYPMMKQSGIKDGAVREECEVCPTQSSEILILCKLWGWVGRDNISGFLCPNRSPIQWRLRGVKIKMSYGASEMLT